MSQHINFLTADMEIRFGESVRLAGRVAHDAINAVLYFVTDDDAEVLNIDLDAYGYSTPQNHVWIKDWSEHAGVAGQLAKLDGITHKATTVVGPFDSPAHLLEIH